MSSVSDLSESTSESHFSGAIPTFNDPLAQFDQLFMFLSAVEIAQTKHVFYLSLGSPFGANHHQPVEHLKGEKHIFLESSLCWLENTFTSLKVN